MVDNLYLYIGILTYLFMGTTMYVLGIGACRLEPQISAVRKQHKAVNSYVALSILFFALMCGLRYRVGADCESYALAFEELKKGTTCSDRESAIEPMFAFFSNVFVSVNAGRVVFLGWFAFMEIAFFFAAMRSRICLFPFLGLVLILGPYFLSWNNALRQTISSCIFIYALVGTIDAKKNLWKYFFWIIIAFLMHKSSVILLPLFVLKFYNKKPNKWMSLALLVFCVYLGHTGLSLDNFSVVQKVMNLLHYDIYSSGFDTFLNKEAEIQSFGPRMIILLAGYFIIILFSDKLDVYFGEDKFFRVSYLLFMIYGCASEALLSLPLLFTRPLLFFQPFVLIMTAYLLYYLKSSKNYICLWISVALTCSYSIINAIIEFQIIEEFANYKYIFFHP